MRRSWLWLEMLLFQSQQVLWTSTLSLYPKAREDFELLVEDRDHNLPLEYQNLQPPHSNSFSIYCYLMSLWKALLLKLIVLVMVELLEL